MQRADLKLIPVSPPKESWLVCLLGWRTKYEQETYRKEELEQIDSCRELKQMCNVIINTRLMLISCMF